MYSKTLQKETKLRCKLVCVMNFVSQLWLIFSMWVYNQFLFTSDAIASLSQLHTPSAYCWFRTAHVYKSLQVNMCTCKHVFLACTNETHTNFTLLCHSCPTTLVTVLETDSWSFPLLTVNNILFVTVCTTCRSLEHIHMLLHSISLSLVPQRNYISLKYNYFVILRVVLSMG